MDVLADVLRVSAMGNALLSRSELGSAVGATIVEAARREAMATSRRDPSRPGGRFSGPHRSVGVVGGEPKCCKSFLALDMAVAVASRQTLPPPLPRR